MNRSTENERFRFWQGRRSRLLFALSMQPDAVQKRNKPFECRVILLGALLAIVDKACDFASKVFSVDNHINEAVL